MKKILIFISCFVFTFFFLVLFLLNIRDVFASTCNTYGNTTYCDGTTYNTYGNTTYGSDGTTYNTYGNTTYVNGPNGYSGTANTYGNTTYYNGTGGDNWTANTYGNTTYVNGNNGTSGTINTYGATSYGDGNVFNTCPANSSYDSLSGKCKCSYGYSVGSSGASCVYSGTYTAPTTPTCPSNSYYDGISSCKCNYGYVVSGSGCVYQATNYSNIPTYTGSTYSCPINSHTSSTDSTKCQCDSGYQISSTKDACVSVPTKTNNQVCADKYRVNSNWDGTKTADGLLNCGCETGSQWNPEKTACISISIPQCGVGYAARDGQCVSNQTDCELSYGKNIVGSPSPTPNFSNCDCPSGYEWGSISSCTKIASNTNPTSVKTTESAESAVAPKKIEAENISSGISSTPTSSPNLVASATSKPTIPQKEYFFQKVWRKILSWF